MRSLFALGLVTAAIFATHVAPAKDAAPVSIREVTLTGNTPLDEATVRTTLGAEVDQVIADVASKKSAVLSVSVTKIAAPAGATEYAVSAVVTDAHGSMLGVVEGHASTNGEKPKSDVDHRVFRNAAHGALSNLPNVLATK